MNLPPQEQRAESDSSSILLLMANCWALRVSLVGAAETPIVTAAKMNAMLLKYCMLQVFVV